MPKNFSPEKSQDEPQNLKSQHNPDPVITTALATSAPSDSDQDSNISSDDELTIASRRKTTTADYTSNFYANAAPFARYRFRTTGRRTDAFAKPTVIYPVIIVFLEFFAWGLLTTPIITQMTNIFGADTFLINGIIQGLKGFLSFLAAPIIGAYSDIKGRRRLLLITVAATCAPIPLLVVQPWWFFTLLSLSGAFAVTYTIVFAYVSDITDEADRNSAFGLVSATFAASLVISPAVGALMEERYGASLVVLLATIVAFVDILFILLFVPESLNYKKAKVDGMDEEYLHNPNAKISWDQVDPFKSLKNIIEQDKVLLMISLAVFLSYLAEAGQYSCFMVYLAKIMKFSQIDVAMFMAWIGILAVACQTALLTFLTTNFNQRTTILVGLTCQALQLIVYSFAHNRWILWGTAVILSISSICYPALNGWCSLICDQEQQGVIQGIITGVRGLCMGMGPAVYGIIFHSFGVTLEEGDGSGPGHGEPVIPPELMPGPAYLFAAILVVMSMIVVIMINQPKHTGSRIIQRLNLTDKSRSNISYQQSVKVQDEDDSPSFCK